MDYRIGQRWVSHTDAQLGLGIVVAAEGRRVTLSFPAVGEERTYAADNAPLTRLRFKPGDRIETVDELKLDVRQVQEDRGLLVYVGIDSMGTERRVSELELDAFVQLTTPQQRLLNGHFDRHAAFALRVSSLYHLDRLQRSGVRGMLGSRTALLPHQVYIAAEVGRRHAPRVLLADEVGLGKTIEAGMIIHQQLVTGRASRVLILVPPTLLHQWLVEMLRRFNLRFALFDAERLLSDPEGNPFEGEQLVISSLELILADPALAAAATEADWDLVALDEAHHLHWSAQAAGEDYRFMERLAARAKGLLLLTATPEQVGQASHFARLRLLDPARFHDLDSFLEEESRYRAWGDLVDALEAGEPVAQLPAGLDPADPPDVLIDQILDRHGTGRVLFRNTRATVSGFPQRELHRHPLEHDGQSPPGAEDIADLLYPEATFEDDAWLDLDPRVAWLERTLKALRPAKVLVICARAATAIALEHYLHLRAGIRSAAFHEGLTILERDRAAAYFAEEAGGAQTLVCSEIGSEGRNFQFAQHLILFDLPLNPDLLEQRIGRLDRIGQAGEVQIHVPFLRGTAQETLLDWYDLGLDAFRQSCSAGYLIFETFRERLLPHLAQRGDDFAVLLDDTAAFTAQTRRELREGRDRLLERNSCRPGIAAALIDQIAVAETDGSLPAYLEALCDVFGVEEEFHSDNSLILRPTEHMLTGHFPGLGDEGTTLTFSRERALVREDMEFLTWEHPIVQEAMDMVLSTELGNAALGTLRLKGVAAGTMLLEVFYTVNCIAPRELGVERFLPLSPFRLLVDARGKDLADLLPHDRLNQLVEKVKKPTALAIIKQVHDEVEAKMKLAAERAEAGLQDTLRSAEQNMRNLLGSELERLRALRRMNGAIREEEVEFLATSIEESAAYIRNAGLQLQALRLIITT